MVSNDVFTRLRDSPRACVPPCRQGNSLPSPGQAIRGARLALADNSAKLFFFYGFIAFLAGFSERWAQDMLVVGRSGGGRSGGSGQAADSS